MRDPILITLIKMQPYNSQPSRESATHPLLHTISLLLGRTPRAIYLGPVMRCGQFSLTFYVFLSSTGIEIIGSWTLKAEKVT